MGMSEEFIANILKCYEVYQLAKIDQWYHNKFLTLLQNFAK